MLVRVECVQPHVTRLSAANVKNLTDSELDMFAHLMCVSRHPYMSSHCDTLLVQEMRDAGHFRLRRGKARAAAASAGQRLHEKDRSVEQRPGPSHQDSSCTQSSVENNLGSNPAALLTNELVIFMYFLKYKLWSNMIKRPIPHKTNSPRCTACLGQNYGQLTQGSRVFGDLSGIASVQGKGARP